MYNYSHNIFDYYEGFLWAQYFHIVVRIQINRSRHKEKIDWSLKVEY